MKRNYVLFGAGVTGMAAVTYFNKEQIIAVIDNCAVKIGTLFEGIPVISFSEYLERYKGIQIIVSIYSDNYFSVKNQLESAGIFNYFTAPPVLYGYDLPEKIAANLSVTNSGRVVFYGINPISIRMYEWLKFNINGEFSFVRTLKEKKESAYDKEYPTILIEELKESDTVVITTNEQEEHIRETLQRYLCKKVYDIYEQALASHDELKVYKNKHKGERCFIIGNGPSLNPQDLEKLRANREVSFGSNKIYLIYKKTLWRPTYYMVIDIQGMQINNQEIRKYMGKTPFIPEFFYVDFSPVEEASRFSMINKIYAPDEDIYFSDDITKGIASGRTVTYAMLQAACYMGFSDIYLLGVDFSWGEKGEDTHFCKDYDDAKWDEFQRTQAVFDKQEIHRAYNAAKKYADQNHINIYNATRGGYLDVFNRVDFDSLFE